MTKKILTIFTAILISYVSFAQSISAGEDYSMLICPGNLVSTWGKNSSGKLGHNDLISKKTPTSIAGISGVTAVSSCYNHSLFLKSDSSVWSCGANSFGQLGNNSTWSLNSPYQLNTLSAITAVSGGNNHSLFLKNDGTVWACGEGYYGALGMGSQNDLKVPTQITSLSGITAVSGGRNHSLFLKNDGTVLACGGNVRGQLGRSGPLGIVNTTPVLVNALSGIIAISAGEAHSLFLKNDGTVWACGDNYKGQLGDGSNLNKKTPIKVDGISGIIAISAGDEYSLFLKNDGTVWACGSGFKGQLGNGTNSNSKIPFKIITLSSIIAISAGKDHSLFLKNDGTVWGCGNNTDGQLGDGTNNDRSTPINLGNICVPPTPPQVNFSNFPTSLCVGSSINIEPTIAGSLPDIGFTIDNSINVTAPKNLAKNSHAVFVLDGADKIMSYDLNGVLQNTYNAASTFTGLTTFAPDESDNVWIHDAINKRLVRLGPGGPTDTSSIGSFMLSSAGDPKFTDMTFTDGPIVENLILVDTSSNTPDLMNGMDINNTNPNLNYTWGLSDSIITKFMPNQHLITSIAFDNKLYPERRMLFADPQHNALWQRKFFGGNWVGSAKYLVDTAMTSRMALDFIETDTTFKFGDVDGTLITTSSSTKNIIGTIYTNVSPNGEINSYLDTVTMSNIVTQAPVGMVNASNNNMPQFWIADKGLNKLIRAQLISYRLTPNLPAGLRFNTVSGKVEGSPHTTSAPQTYQLIISNGLGSDTTYFVFGITPTGPLNNTPGVASASGIHNDGLTIKYYEPNNCGTLIEIADAIGGTSPGQTQMSQTVYPLVSVIANDSLIRRVNSIRAENQDALTVNVKLFYSYQDIQAFNLTRGSNLLNNDTIVGTMNMAVLQMHDKPNGSKEPIIHSPIAAVWSNTKHHWEATVPVTKFSEFYGSDITTLNSFDCKTIGTQTLSVGANYYVWNNDTLFASGTYKDTLINVTGCDSIANLNLTLFTTGISEMTVGQSVLVYPNPNNGMFNVSFVGNSVLPSRIRIVNVLGNEVYNENISGNTQINLTGFNSGMYFVTIETNEKPLIYRIIKE